MSFFKVVGVKNSRDAVNILTLFHDIGVTLNGPPKFVNDVDKNRDNGFSVFFENFQNDETLSFDKLKLFKDLTKDNYESYIKQLVDWILLEQSFLREDSSQRPFLTDSQSEYNFFNAFLKEESFFDKECIKKGVVYNDKGFNVLFL